MLHEKLLPIWNAIFHDNLPANVKHCMELLGRPAGVPRAPMPATSVLAHWIDKRYDLGSLAARPGWATHGLPCGSPA